jgi:trk system potassium uptake protein TrkH
MNIKTIGFYMGHILRLLAVLMIPPLVIAVFLHEKAAAVGLAATVAATLGAGLLMLFFRKPDQGGIRPLEGYVTVALGWIFISLFGALPFFISRHIPSYIDSFFEVVSGFTTTGATILKDVEALPQSLLYWRSFTHWIGGMGVLVFILAIVPLTSGDSIFIMRAESPGPQVNKLVPRTRQSARILYEIYIGLTVLQIGLMLLGGAFTFLASGASLLLLGMFLTSTGLYLNNWWMVLAAIACMGGASRAFGMDYYLPAWYCRAWEYRQKNGRIRLLFHREK